MQLSTIGKEPIIFILREERVCKAIKIANVQILWAGLVILYVLKLRHPFSTSKSEYTLIMPVTLFHQQI